MVDRERVIKGLTAHMNGDCNKKDCPWFECEEDGCIKSMFDAALKLLKEQETVKSTSDDTESIKPYAQGDGSYACNNCGETVGWEEMNCGGISLVKYKYCPECGRRIRWNG